MASNQDQDPKRSTSYFTPGSRLGTQPRQSYSTGEMATPSGEVIFNFRSTGSNDDASREGQVHTPRFNSRTLVAVEGSPVTGGIPTSDGRSATHGTDTVEDIGRRADTQATASVGRAGLFAAMQEEDFGQGGRQYFARRDLDRGVQFDRNRFYHSGVRTDNLPLYRTTRTDRESDMTLPIRSTLKKPANFDGTTSLQDYLVQFEMTSELNRWDDNVKAMELATSLRGAAQSILSDLRPEQRRSYDSLVDALTARFEPNNQTELYRAQIKGRLRKKSESVQELAQDIKRLVRRAYPQASSDLRDQIARDCFIDALNEHELEFFVYQGKPRSVDEATQLALEFEAFQSGRKRSHMVRQCTKGDNPESDTLAKINEQLEKLQTEITDMKNNPDRNVVCYSCKDPGHKSKDCPKRNKQLDHPYNRYHNKTQSYQDRRYNRQANSHNNRNNQGNAH